MLKKKPLKKSLTGLEIELSTLNEKGEMIFAADQLISKVKRKDKNVDIVKECSKNMIEIRSYPSTKVSNTALNMLNSLQVVLEVAEKNNIVIFPHSTYPGKFVPKIRDDRWYQIKSGIIGRKRFLNAGLCFGYHNHYTLPKGVFDNKNKFLKNLVKSKIKETLIDSYNLSIAMDPVLIALLQSSPFVQGRYIAKDSRVVIYRGGKSLDYNNGLYSNLQYFGALPRYKHTLADLKLTLNMRHKHWKRMMTENGFHLNGLVKQTNTLNFGWNPVIINKLGTLEQRSMDTNHPKYIIGISMLLKLVLREVQRNFLHVVSSDIGIDEPFKLEGKVLYIPPYAHLKNKLQVGAAYNGLENKEIVNLCKRFLNFARSCTQKEYMPVLKPILDLFSQRTTVSDKIIKRFRKRGYGKEGTIPNNVCAEVALKSCNQLFNEIEKTKENVANLI
jgi:carboxylate-amine ligase